MATMPRPEDENTKVGHSRFISEAAMKDKWNGRNGDLGKEITEIPGEAGEEVNGLPEGQGRVLPTSSHLFKLILPLTPPTSLSARPPHTIFLLHPSQPLSHLARLINSSLGRDLSLISFRSVSQSEPHNEEVEWSDSTDIGDFIKSAVSEEHFNIVLSPVACEDNNSDAKDATPSSKTQKETGETTRVRDEERVITVKIPSFKDRTQFLRRRLRTIEAELGQMEQLKLRCDKEAHRGARRMALGGFGMLVVYWMTVARLTFYDYGWDVMEPITYLSGLSTVICGYLWFLYRGREVSYSSVLQQSVSKRRDALYKSRGLDIEHWLDLIAEQKTLRREMNKIADDYDVRWEGSWDGKHSVREEDREAEKRKLEQDVD